MEKALKELILALKSIAYALMGKGNNNDDNENNINYTWYDFIKENCVDPVTPYLEQSNFSDKRNPIPVGIYDVNNGENFHLFKDIDIKENIIEKYNIDNNNSRVIYEEPPRLFQSEPNNFWGSLYNIIGISNLGYGIEFIYCNYGFSIDTIEYNGKTYYYATYSGD